MKRIISILGSTGSVGESSFKILNKKNLFKFNVLAADKNYRLICKQIDKFKPNVFIVNNKDIFVKVKKNIK